VYKGVETGFAIEAAIKSEQALRRLEHVGQTAVLRQRCIILQTAKDKAKESAQGGMKPSEMVRRYIKKKEPICPEVCADARRKLAAMEDLVRHRKTWEEWDCDTILGSTAEHGKALEESLRSIENLKSIIRICEDAKM
jgi:hypothetical protein